MKQARIFLRVKDVIVFSFFFLSSRAHTHTHTHTHVYTFALIHTLSFIFHLLSLSLSLSVAAAHDRTKFSLARLAASIQRLKNIRKGLKAGIKLTKKTNDNTKYILSWNERYHFQKTICGITRIKKKSACRNVRVRKKEHRYMIEGGDIYAYACVRVFVSVRHFFFFVQSIFHFHRTNFIVF